MQINNNLTDKMGAAMANMVIEELKEAADVDSDTEVGKFAESYYEHVNLDPDAVI